MNQPTQIYLRRKELPKPNMIYYYNYYFEVYEYKYN